MTLGWMWCLNFITGLRYAQVIGLNNSQVLLAKTAPVERRRLPLWDFIIWTMIVIWFCRSLEDTGFGHWCSAQMVYRNAFMWLTFAGM